jgi:glyoxylase I family protein
MSKETFADLEREGWHRNAREFAAGSRADVDELFDKLKTLGAKILDAPQEYPYVPGYYALFFTDPDGMKLEYVHIPG